MVTGAWKSPAVRTAEARAEQERQHTIQVDGACGRRMIALNAKATVHGDHFLLPHLPCRHDHGDRQCSRERRLGARRNHLALGDDRQDVQGQAADRIALRCLSRAEHRHNLLKNADYNRTPNPARNGFYGKRRGAAALPPLAYNFEHSLR